MNGRVINGSSMPTIRPMHGQRGVSLVELLVATAVSLIAISGMILMMSSSVGATTTVVSAARLSNDLRAARQVISRDIRRANYTDDFYECIGAGQNCTAVANTVAISNTGDDDCIGFSYEREGATVQGAVKFFPDTGILGYQATSSNCAATSGWEPLNDPNVVAITRFEINNTNADTGGYTLLVANDTLLQTVRKFRIEIEGETCARGTLGNCNETITRAVSHTIRVRNDTLEST